MKKRIRLLSVIMSLVLLFSIATPAMAYDNNNPPPSEYRKTKAFSDGVYTINLTLNDDAVRYHHYMEEVEFNPWYQTSAVLSGSVAANTKTWTISTAFNPTYRSNIEQVSQAPAITSTYSNRGESYYFVIDQAYPRGTYTATLTCWHYKVSANVALNAGGEFAQTVDRVPVVNGDYVYVFA